ncbi:zinc finger protein 710-like [Pollicipes pollicipes]|uniref:zinc finger protein 710-like n=1 Tax=Pollicipes pollicipes TaxID=41117 RepID=UPI001884B5D5|nr:zinc finger protein 710-like [Pollicipes pollicipes]
MVHNLRSHMASMHRLSADEVADMLGRPRRSAVTWIPRTSWNQPQHHLKKHQGLTTCLICGLTYSTVHSLRRHMESIHKMAAADVRVCVPTRRYIHSVVPEDSYTNPHTLQRHLKKHQGLTTCPVCNKVCSMVHNLRQHMRTVHRMSPEEVHARIPTRKLALDAGAGSLGACHATAENISPWGGGPVHVCTDCGQAYTNPQSLLQHLKKHQGLTTCPVCYKVCSMVHNLRQHMQAVHRMTPAEVRARIPTRKSAQGAVTENVGEHRAAAENTNSWFGYGER